MRTLRQIRASLPVYPVEVDFPDIQKWKNSATGVDYVHSFYSPNEGPHVMVMALVHGNEVSGAIAVCRLLERGIRPLRGRVTVGFANIEAYHAFDPDNADNTRYLDEDFNRVWSPQRFSADPASDTREMKRARELKPIVDTVDFLFDMHSMHEEAPPLMMSGTLDKGIEFAQKIGVPASIVRDTGHPNGVRMRDYGGFGDPDSPKNALLIETGQHFSRLSAEVAIDSVARFLVRTGAVATSDMERFMTRSAGTAPQPVFEVTEPVTADTMGFDFVGQFLGMEVIPKAGTVIARDNGREVVTPYDNCVMVQPSIRQLGPGVTVVRLAKIISE